MNSFDTIIIGFLNSYSQLSFAVDKFITIASDQSLIKGGIFATIVWLLWFNKHRLYNTRGYLLTTLASSTIAIVIGRVLALILPFRLRPLHNPHIVFIIPFTMSKGMEDWSSFPSDHAVLFIALSVGIFYSSRLLGVFTLIYSTFIILLPRIYLGLHYPTDIVAGAFVGIVIGWLCHRQYVVNIMDKLQYKLTTIAPGIFYMCLFFFTYQLANMFIDVRLVGSFLSYFIKNNLTN